MRVITAAFAALLMTTYASAQGLSPRNVAEIHNTVSFFITELSLLPELARPPGMDYQAVSDRVDEIIEQTTTEDVIQRNLYEGMQEGRDAVAFYYKYLLGAAYPDSEIFAKVWHPTTSVFQVCREDADHYLVSHTLRNDVRASFNPGSPDGLPPVEPFDAVELSTCILVMERNPSNDPDAFMWLIKEWINTGGRNATNDELGAWRRPLMKLDGETCTLVLK